MSSGAYFLAPAAVTLRDEVDKAFPKRDRSSDGWIGDPAHAARKSDHNPCWYCSGKSHGIVRAVDLDIAPDGNPDRDLAAEILRATIGDPRVAYVIHRSKIYSRTYGWQAHVYTGHPHDGHVHVSLVHHEGANFDTRPWGITSTDGVGKDPRPPRVSLSAVRHAAGRPRRKVHPRQVRRVQRSLNARMGSRLTIDGIYGPATRRAYARWQYRLGYRGTDADGLPGLSSLTRLGANRFTVIR